MLVKSLAIVAATTLPFVSGLAIKRDGSSPGYPTDPNATKDCTYWIDNDDAGVSACKDALDFWIVSPQDFHKWNPSVDLKCNGFKSNMSYCVEGPKSPVTTTTSSIQSTSTTTIASTTKPGNGITTPTPTQPGMVDNCNKFYKVQKDENCDIVAGKNGITRKDLQTWNTELGDDCSGIWADVYVCVNVIGRDPSPTTTKPNNGVTTPTPTQPGMVDNCNKFYKVQKDENCDTVAGKNGISRKALQLWNTKLGDDCSGIWANVYVCVGVIDGQDPGTPADPPNSVQTPTPVQRGITNVCKKFHKVEAGQGCDVVANMYGISPENYINWNTNPGGGCGDIWGQTYSCVGLIGNYDFEDGTNQRWTTVDGSFKPQNGGIVGSQRGKAVLKAGLNDFAFSIDVTVASGGGTNAGVLFRASDVGNGPDSYNGYYFGISADGYGLLGRASHNWNELRRFNMDVRTGQKYRVKVLALADQISIFVDDMYNAQIVVNDGTFRSGYAGLRVYDTDATYDNALIEPIVFDKFERNLVNWKIGDGGFDARTGEIVSSETDSGKIALNTQFDDFVFEGDLLLQKSGGGNVGFIVRANDLGSGADSYRGYYVGIGTDGKLTLGAANYNWREISSRDVGFTDNRWYHIKVICAGDSISIYVDDMANAKITVRDGTFRSGKVGVRVFRSAAKADNIRVTPSVN